MQHDVPSIFAGHYDPSFPLVLCLKDLFLIEELMDQVGTRNELTRATHDRFKEAAPRSGLAVLLIGYKQEKRYKTRGL